jgi:hypothetical protein
MHICCIVHTTTTTGAPANHAAVNSIGNYDVGYSSESFVDDDKSNDISTLSIPDLDVSLPHKHEQQQHRYVISLVCYKTCI